MRSIAGVAIVAAALVISGGALAESPNYTFVELGYQMNDPDSDYEGETFKWTHDNGNGFFLGGSWGNDVFHVFGEYGMSQHDTTEYYEPVPLPVAPQSLEPLGNGTVDTTTYELGFGIHGLLGEKADLIGEAGYAYEKHDEEDAAGMRWVDSTDGLFIRFGARWRVIELLELNGYITNLSLTGADAYQTFEANAMFFVWKLAIGLGYTYGNLRLEDSFFEEYDLTPEYRNPSLVRLYVRYEF
jgi:hypothetical protein